MFPIFCLGKSGLPYNDSSKQRAAQGKTMLQKLLFHRAGDSHFFRAFSHTHTNYTHNSSRALWCTRRRESLWGAKVEEDVRWSGAVTVTDGALAACLLPAASDSLFRQPHVVLLVLPASGDSWRILAYTGETTLTHGGRENWKPEETSVSLFLFCCSFFLRLDFHG